VREDLLREATALIQRAEIRLPGSEEPLAFGFRRDGAASFYFGEGDAYQFNAAGELRRVYASALLYKAERGRLVSLYRERTATETALIRGELSAAETLALIATIQQRLQTLHAALHTGHFTLVGQVPPGGSVIQDACIFLSTLPTPLPIAQAPNLKY
jgi:hypothetical protein